MRSSKDASAPSNWNPWSSSALTCSRIRRESGVSWSMSIPYSRAFQRMLDFPANSETSTRRWLPTASGLMCSYVSGCFWTAETCMPPLCANAESPTYGCEDQGLRLASSDTELAQARLRDAVEPELQDEARDNRHEVRIAAALAEAIERPLHLADPLADGGERVRDGALGVVVHVDPQRRPHVLLHGLDRGDELGRQGAAVGVAENEPVCPSRFRGHQRGHRVVGVGAEAVEEVLGVEDDLVHPGPEERDRVADHGEILGKRRAEGLGHVEVPRLADDRRHRRAGVEHRAHVGVRVGGAAGAPGHAERRELGVLERDVLHAPEEAEVLRVRARPSALYIMNAERVEPGREPNLIFHRERHAFALGAIAERGVVDLDQAAHGCFR